MNYKLMIDNINEEILKLKKQKKLLEEEWANNECPIKVGDDYTINSKNKIKVTKVKAGYSLWFIEGFLYKKDGSVGMKTSSAIVSMEEAL